VAKEAGADIVKFQTFITESFVTRNAPKAEYQKGATGEGTQYEMIKKLELPYSDFKELYEYCGKRKIQFLATCDYVSIDFVNSLNPEYIKIPSGEVTNLPYLRKMGGLEKKIILSTGMSTLGEIEEALQILEDAGTLRSTISLLHCNTEYPTPFEDVNLKAMVTLRTAFPGISVGYSDHTSGIEVPVAAVALGATIIEKHFTLDRNLPGPDHRASLEPVELKAMVQAIRNIEKALGDGIKRPSPSEVKNIPIARKSIVAARSIRKGEAFTAENLTIKRPGTGINPMRWDEVLGRIAQKDFEKDDLI
jgi:N,N'-diacetyllegionaminate synthase